MTTKMRGIRLKKRLSLEDQGQRKLLQVTYSQLAALGSTQADASTEEAQPLSPTDAKRSRSASKTRRRAIARMLRIELESTLTLLDEALDNIGAQLDPAKPES